MMNGSERQVIMSFEQAFSDTEKAADSTIKSATDLARWAKSLQKEARKGNIGAIKRAASKLSEALGTLKQEVGIAVAIWPFQNEEEEAYLREYYASELREAAAEKGLDIHERDGLLISHPSILRILPSNRAVRIDKKQVSALRPSYLSGILKENQKKPPRFRSETFLKALQERYWVLAKAEPPRLDGHGPVIPLARIYEAFTSLPGIKREYSKIDFARDVYFLECSGKLLTTSGFRVSFPSSTGTKTKKDTFPFVGPDGQVITYYGIQFSRGE
jgi:hypothetical protein